MMKIGLLLKGIFALTMTVACMSMAYGAARAKGPGSLEFSAATYHVYQSSGKSIVTVKRVGGSTGNVTVRYVAYNGTAEGITDFAPTTGLLSWANGDATSKTFTVPLKTAEPFSGTKYFYVDMGWPTGATITGTPSATVTIVGEDSASTESTTPTAVTSTASSSTSTVAAISTAAISTAIKPLSTTSTSSTSGTSSSSSTSSSTASKPSSTSSPTATVDPTQEVVVNAASVIAPIVSTQVGSNMGSWFDVTLGGVASAISATGPHLVRWPGGSNSDAFHWQTMSMCTREGGYANPNSTFDNLMKQVVTPNGLEVAVTVNYGSNAACTGGGSPAEAAAWVAYSKSKGYNAHHWTVGNEVYGSWEFDLHAKPHDAATYAAAVGVSGGNGYYQQMKAADPTAQVGVVVEPNWNGWDAIVLKQASYDFVELHWYPEQAGSESDSYLLTQAMSDFDATISALRSDLASAGKPNTPIMIGEFNSVNTNPGKQTLSIVNALFMGMTYGEILNNGVALATAWAGYGGTCTSNANNSSSLYGWQNFGGYDEVSDGAPWWSGCGGSTTIPAGTVLPSGYAQNLVSQFATPGGNMLSATVGSALTNVRAYASSSGSGYAVMLFNLSETATTAVTVAVSNASSSSFNATTVTYGKAQYDNSKNNVWTAPVTQTLGTANGSVSVSLPPWSMTVLKLDN